MGYTKTIDQGLCKVTLTGEVDDTISAMFTTVSRLPNLTAIAFDCDAITRINSIGIKLWVQGMQQLPAGTKISFHKCPMVFLEVAAMIPAFTRGHPIESCYIGYICESCDSELVALVPAGPAGPQLAQPLLCPTCKNPLATDEYAQEQLDLIFSAS